MAYLFDPIELRSLELKNRIIISPMCQYSAINGSANSWHTIHLGQLSLSAAGCLIIEATAINPEGRISHGCLGLYTDRNEADLAKTLNEVRKYSRIPIGIQLGHAGRKASVNTPWNGGSPLTTAANSWQTVAPSAEAFDVGWHCPMRLNTKNMESIIQNLVAATKRATRLNLDLVELHCAHGYLFSQFLSPISNKRCDKYGGNLTNRMRFPLKAAEQMRQIWPKTKPMGIRLNGTDWVQGGITVEEAIIFTNALKEIGIDYVCISSGGNTMNAKIPAKPGYQVYLATKIKKETALPTMAVGLITNPHQANEIIGNGGADMVAMARAFLHNPRWPWHAAEALGTPLEVNPQYMRALPSNWPGYTKD